ncbi:MAG: CpXC domain-containing protein [Treponema sp.]|jgi:hypothetical protein|nr:CpXC domain-containing protein [Treponema sp.]
MNKKEHKIPCFCDNSFTVEVPEFIDLDASPQYLEEIINGTFLKFICPKCGKKHKPEFALSILWPKNKVRFEVHCELDRRKFYLEKKGKNSKKEDITTETIIGYPELSDRLLVYRDKLEPAVVEAVKYFLYLKAEENYPEKEINIWYNGLSGDNLEFHIHGIKDGEAAVLTVPSSLYDKTLKDYKKNPKGELFASLRVKTYLSVKNMMSR